MDYSLPQQPLTKLPKAFAVWEETAKNLPKLLVSNFLRNTVEKLPVFPVKKLKNAREFERAMMILSYLGHAYVWGEKQIPTKLPKVLAKSWCEVAKKLKRPPVLSYASYALNNWQKIDKTKPVVLGNIVLLQNFLGGMDEEWFILVHVEIEFKALAFMRLLPEIIKKSDLEKLSIIRDGLENICNTLDRMPEHCDPYIYYNRVRPYIHGWKNHPAFPNGLIYEGVYQNKPQQFRGETGAQSAIIPCMDALLGITHMDDLLGEYLKEMRLYMPIQHRNFLEWIEKNSKVREQVKNSTAAMKNIYNQCIKLIARFRSTHLHYAASYIQQQAQKSAENPNAVGTGGTPFMEYLRKHKEETEKFLL